ncbi:transposable element Tc1 transposase [Trichonephila clavipes]|nr:transposable element Tc1 transposase [Trichonephila clavipes]
MPEGIGRLEWKRGGGTRATDQLSVTPFSFSESIVPHPVEGFLNVEEGTPGSISTVEPVDNPIGQTEELLVCRRFASEPVLEVWDKPITKARDIAESHPPSKGNYLKVSDHLKSRFGRKDFMIEVYIRDLLAIVNNISVIKLTDLYNKLGSYLQALETLNVTTSNFAAMLYPVVESCLSVEVLKAWDRHRLNKEVPEDIALEKEKVLENLMTFLST